MRKQKCLNLGIFDPKCLVWIFLGKNFRKTIVILDIGNQHPQICLFAKFYEKNFFLPKFGTKNAWFGYFGTGT